MMILVIFAPFVYNITLSKTGKERKKVQQELLFLRQELQQW